MIDFSESLRTAYYQALNGNLTFNATTVPVSDSVEKLADKDNLYVLLMQQTGASENDQAAFRSQETMQLDIVYRGTRVAKSVVDDIWKQIKTIIFPSVQGNALPPQPGLSVINMRFTDSKYMIFKVTGGLNVTKRMITITQLCSDGESGNGGGIPVFNIPSPITSPDFTNSTDYNNTALKYVDYFLFLNDASVYLLEGTDYVKIASGGFTILLPNFDASINFYTFYIVQQ
jgi:hypothetical protein